MQVPKDKHTEYLRVHRNNDNEEKLQFYFTVERSTHITEIQYSNGFVD